MIEIIFKRPLTIYNSSEPINLALFFKSEAFMFSSACLIEFIQLWPETLQHIERFSDPFCLLHLIEKWFFSFRFLWSYVPFFHFFSSSDSQLCVEGFLIKQLFYSGLLDMKWSLPTRRYAPRWLYIISYPARPRRIIVKYIHIYKLQTSVSNEDIKINENQSLPFLCFCATRFTAVAALQA